MLWLLFIALVLVVLWRRASVARAAVPLLVLALFTATFSFGLLRFALMSDNLADTALSSHVGNEVTLQGQIIREPDIREETALLVLKTADTRVLLSTDRFTPIRYGDRVEVTGKLELPDTFTTEYGREFDYAGYLAARRITHTMSFVTPEIIETNSGVNLLLWLYEAKAYFLERLSLVLPEPQFGLGAGLLLGVQSALGEDLEEAFRVSGIVHIVVLSGYNIMLVVAFVIYVLSFFLPYRWRLIFGIGAVIVFALLVGYSPSVVRASTMAVLFLIASLLARRYVILRMLCVAGGLMIFINPYLLRYDIGFQLSFMATLGLILVAPQFEMLMSKVSGKLDLKSYFIATVATQIAAAPLILYYIGQWSLIAVPVNLLVLPMVPVAMLTTFITGLAAMVSLPLATPLAFTAYLSLSYIILIATKAAALPFAAVVVPPFPAYFIPILYAFLGGAYWWWSRAEVKPKVLEKKVLDDAISEVEDWTIEEEKTLVPEKTKAVEGAKAPSTAQKDIPIFFR